MLQLDLACYGSLISSICADHTSLESSILAAQAFLVVRVKHGKDKVFDDLRCQLWRHMLYTHLLVAGLIGFADRTTAPDTGR